MHDSVSARPIVRVATQATSSSIRSEEHVSRRDLTSCHTTTAQNTRWAVIRKLGKGNFGSVVLVERMREGKLDQAALKCIMHDSTRRVYLDAEIYCLRAARRAGVHDITRLMGVAHDTNCTQIMCEFMEGGDVLKQIVSRGALPPHVVRHGAESLTRALCFLHKLGIVHRDLKPENILLSRKPTSGSVEASTSLLGAPELRAASPLGSGHPARSHMHSLPGSAGVMCSASEDSEDWGMKLADFGLARAATPESPVTTVAGTVQYSAPEQLFPARTGYWAPADMFALGITLYAMLCGKHPFDRAKLDWSTVPSAALKEANQNWSSEKTCKLAITIAFADPAPMVGGPWDHVPAMAKDWISRCLQKNPAKRMTAEQALQHPWLSSSAPSKRAAHTSPLAAISSSQGRRPLQSASSSQLGSDPGISSGALPSALHRSDGAVTSLRHAALSRLAGSGHAPVAAGSATVDSSTNMPGLRHIDERQRTESQHSSGSTATSRSRSLSSDELFGSGGSAAPPRRAHSFATPQAALLHASREPVHWSADVGDVITVASHYQRNTRTPGTAVGAHVSSSPRQSGNGTVASSTGSSASFAWRAGLLQGGGAHASKAVGTTVGAASTFSFHPQGTDAVDMAWRGPTRRRG